MQRSVSLLWHFMSMNKIIHEGQIKYKGGVQICEHSASDFLSNSLCIQFLDRTWFLSTLSQPEKD